jgi:uncharacterized protein (UPF0332 family)
VTSRGSGPPFDWTSFLEYAEARVACRSQFMRRLVIDRAYYAAFHVARCGLRDLGVADADERFHRQLWKHFTRAAGAAPGQARAWRMIGEIGDRLHAERTRADYEAHATWSADDCARIVDDARELVNRVGALTSR